MNISKENKYIANSARNAFGGKPKVHKYADEKETSNIDILSVIDSPEKGVTSYSSIGLNSFAVKETPEGVPISIEIVGSVYSKYNEFANILATCAFNIINSNFSCSHGEVFRDVVHQYYPKFNTQHILFTAPYLWEESLQTIHFDDCITVWLLAIPISQKEYDFLIENGFEALEESFEKNGINIFDIDRKSIF